MATHHSGNELSQQSCHIVDNATAPTQLVGHQLLRLEVLKMTSRSQSGVTRHQPYHAYEIILDGYRQYRLPSDTPDLAEEDEFRKYPFAAGKTVFQTTEK